MRRTDDAFDFLAESKKKLTALSQQSWTVGVVLLSCVAVAMLLANLPFTKDLYFSLLETKLQIHLFNDEGLNVLFPRDMTIERFINDILMTLFFFSVGLEIRREIRYGELSSPKKATMPIIAAFGGVIFPALIYTAFNHSTPASSGWGIPTATDIGFAVCLLSVLGDKVPKSLKVFLTALAIADDLIAILVVAVFYGGELNLHLLLIAAGVIGIVILLRRLKVNGMIPYLILATFVWILFYYSGIHATMSGVVMAFLIPSRARYDKHSYADKMKYYLDKIDTFSKGEEDDMFPNLQQKIYLVKMNKLAQGSVDMCWRVERFLSPIVNFIIMPLFALANAGVHIPDLSYLNIFATVADSGLPGVGIFLGLLIGKPLGITLFSFIAIKMKIGIMPKAANWKMFFAVACLGGIGFTMSIFVDSLAFSGQNPEIIYQLRNVGKVAILFGSVCSAILGSVLINLFAKRRTPEGNPRQ